jgi:hypothetical protein
MNDKELAEKVAEKLGWSKGKHGNQVWFKPCGYLGNVPTQTPVMTGAYPELEDVIFKDWNTFGLMIEKADEMGWRLYSGTCIDIYEPVFWFVRYWNNGESATETSPHSTKKHGHIKACALAFVELPND